MTQDNQQLLHLAVDTAQEVGCFLEKSTSELKSVNQEIERDVKIEADLQSERMIIDLLKVKTNFSILSEECGFIEQDNKEYCWIIDPVDGSLNYSRGIPICCVSIGLWKNDEPLIGVIHDFNRKETYAGIVGRSSYLNDVEINVSKNSDKMKSILISGFPVKTEMDQDNLDKFINHVKSYKKMRIIGSAAISLAYVACGRADAYYEKDICLWDIAAGVPLILAAGGYVDYKETDKKYCYELFVSNGKFKN